MDAVARYEEAFKALYDRTSAGAVMLNDMLKVFEQFSVEDRKVIAAGRFHDSFEFSLYSLGAQILIRECLKDVSPDADLSWIPNRRDGYDAYLASTQNKS